MPAEKVTFQSYHFSVASSSLCGWRALPLPNWGGVTLALLCGQAKLEAKKLPTWAEAFMTGKAATQFFQCFALLGFGLKILTLEALR